MPQLRVHVGVLVMMPILMPHHVAQAYRNAHEWDWRSLREGERLQLGAVGHDTAGEGWEKDGWVVYRQPKRRVWYVRQPDMHRVRLRESKLRFWMRADVAITAAEDLRRAHAR